MDERLGGLNLRHRLQLRNGVQQVLVVFARYFRQQIEIPRANDQPSHLIIGGNLIGNRPVLPPRQLYPDGRSHPLVCRERVQAGNNANHTALHHPIGAVAHGAGRHTNFIGDFGK